MCRQVSKKSQQLKLSTADQKRFQQVIFGTNLPIINRDQDEFVQTNFKWTFHNFTQNGYQKFIWQLKQDNITVDQSWVFILWT